MVFKFIRKLYAHSCVKYLLGAGIVCLLFALYADTTVARFGKDVYTEVEETPCFQVGLLLGTAREVSGRPNIFYTNRIEAAAKLYQSGKIKKIIASGDGSTLQRCEPEQMRDDLVKKGVPIEAIVLDYAGLRTLDSVIRSKAIFGADSILIISQDFHCRRALFIAKDQGIYAKGFAARDANSRAWKLRSRIRELAARTMAFLDVKLLNREPKFYGDPIAIFSENSSGQAGSPHAPDF